MESTGSLRARVEALEAAHSSTGEDTAQFFFEGVTYKMQKGRALQACNDAIANMETLDARIVKGATASMHFGKLLRLLHMIVK